MLSKHIATIFLLFIRDRDGYANGLPNRHLLEDIVSNTTNTNNTEENIMRSSNCFFARVNVIEISKVLNVQ